MTAKPKLLDQVRQALRLKHYSYETEKTYVQWIKRFIFFHDKRHPEEMGKEEVAAFLIHLAVKQHVAASTQNQALSAILFLYNEVLQSPLGWLEITWAKKPERLPVVLTREEVKAVLAHLSGVNLLIVQLLYGAGLRLNECLGLRVQDIDFGQNLIVVRDGKGQKDRTTAFICTIVRYSGPSEQQRKKLALANGSAPTSSATVLPLIYWKVAATFVPFKSYWATKMCARR